MLELIKAFLHKKRYFIVTSHGNTGTMWLAMKMNNHPEIFCTHSYQYPIVTPQEKLSLEKNGANLLENINKHFWQLSLDQFFDQHEQVTHKKIIGNVHGFTFARFWQMLPSLKSERRRNLKILNMIRHPVTRISSCYNHWLEGDDNKFQFIDLDVKNNCEHIHYFLKKKKHKIEMTYENRAFIVALLQSEHVAQDVETCHKEGIGNIIFEDMTNNPDYYNRIFKGLTKLNPKEIETLDESSIQHKHNPKRMTAIEHFESWESWKKDAFRFVAKRANMKTIYSNYNYDLSFAR